MSEDTLTGKIERIEDLAKEAGPAADELRKEAKRLEERLVAVLEIYYTGRVWGPIISPGGAFGTTTKEFVDEHIPPRHRMVAALEAFSELSGDTDELPLKLWTAEIQSVAELAQAEPEEIEQATGLSSEEAGQLIQAAEDRQQADLVRGYTPEEGTGNHLTLVRRDGRMGLAIEEFVPDYPPPEGGGPTGEVVLKKWLVDASLEELREGVEAVPALVDKLAEEMEAAVRENREAAAFASDLAESLEGDVSRGA